MHRPHENSNSLFFTYSGIKFLERSRQLETHLREESSRRPLLVRRVQISPIPLEGNIQVWEGKQESRFRTTVLLVHIRASLMPKTRTGNPLVLEGDIGRVLGTYNVRREYFYL